MEEKGEESEMRDEIRRETDLPCSTVANTETN